MTSDLKIPRHAQRLYTSAIITLNATYGSRVIEGAMSNDGQLFVFNESDIVDLLANYPRDKLGWFFNKTKDRYVAERISFGISVNPSFVYRFASEILV